MSGLLCFHQMRDTMCVERTGFGSCHGIDPRGKLTARVSVPYPDGGIIRARGDELFGVQVGNEATAPHRLLVTLVLGY